MTSTSTQPRPNRTRWYAVAVAAIVGIGIWAVIVSNGLGNDAAVQGAPLGLSLGDGAAMASCIQFDVENLADMSTAFEGTVTSVDGDAITMTVDRWYRGGEAATVSLTAPQGMQALIGGIDFVEGDQYLVTATDGNVNYCGYTGESTPELRSAFDQAFAG